MILLGHIREVYCTSIRGETTAAQSSAQMEMLIELVLRRAIIISWGLGISVLKYNGLCLSDLAGLSQKQIKCRTYVTPITITVLPAN